MANPVYSVRFWAESAFTGGPTPVYVVPAGYVAVVHTIAVVWGDTAVSGLDFWVQGAGAPKLVRVTSDLFPMPFSIGGSQVWNGRWTLNAGDNLQLVANAGTVDTWGSGYLLTLP